MSTRSETTYGELLELERAVTEARLAQRYADASIALEAYLDAARHAAAPPRTSNTSYHASSASRRNAADASLDAAVSARSPRPKLARAQRTVDKASASSAPERLRYLSLVHKRNKKNKIQSRLLGVTDVAVYNLSADGVKVKRRIRLELLASITRDELSDRFIIHVPSEYDYDLVALHPGLVVSRDGFLSDASSTDGSCSGPAIRALQEAYTACTAKQRQLPVRSWVHDALSHAVQRKAAYRSSSRRTDSSSSQSAVLDELDFDDDDDDDDDDASDGGSFL